MSDYLDLPGYTDFESLSNNPVTGISIQRACSVKNPSKYVIIKAATIFNQEINNALKEEYDILSKLEKLYNSGGHSASTNRMRRTSFQKYIALPTNESQEAMQVDKMDQDPPSYPFPAVISLESMYEDACFAIIYEDFNGINLRNIYPGSMLDTETRASQTLSEVLGNFRASKDELNDLHRSRNSFGGSMENFRKLHFEEIISIAAQVADILDWTHRAKVVHLDVNPSNIVIQHTPEGIYAILSDYGLAKQYKSIYNANGSQSQTCLTYVSPGTHQSYM